MIDLEKGGGLVWEPLLMDGVREYIKTLRNSKGLSQKKLASIMGWGERTYIKFETGETDDIKLQPLALALDYLGGSPAHVHRLILEQSSAEGGRALAQMLIDGTAPAVEGMFWSQVISEHGQSRTDVQARLDQLNLQDRAILRSMVEQVLRFRIPGSRPDGDAELPPEQRP